MESAGRFSSQAGSLGYYLHRRVEASLHLAESRHSYARAGSAGFRMMVVSWSLGLGLLYHYLARRACYAYAWARGIEETNDGGSLAVSTSSGDLNSLRYLLWNLKANNVSDSVWPINAGICSSEEGQKAAGMGNTTNYNKQSLNKTCNKQHIQEITNNRETNKNILQQTNIYRQSNKHTNSPQRLGLTEQRGGRSAIRLCVVGETSTSLVREHRPNH